MIYDYLIVGAGLFGSVFAHEMKRRGKKILVIDRRSHIGGNCFTEEICGINVHRYGAHIFHTSNKEIWDYLQQFVELNNYINSPIAIYNDEVYNMPFNMNTFSKMWGIKTPAEAKKIIATQIAALDISKPKNFKEQALLLVGSDVYEKLVKGYTEKQWGRKCEELPAFIIRRLPLRFTYDNNYFTDRFQGVPIGGYTQIFEQLLNGIEVHLNTDYKMLCNEKIAKKIIYSGCIDEFFNYCYGPLQYRSLRFETKVVNTDNYQGNAVVNYTDINVPYTRIIEHKHFESSKKPKTIISYEYPIEWSLGKEPYYPINNKRNMILYGKYRKLAESYSNVIFGGRLGTYKYYNMDEVIRAALDLALKE